MGFFKEFFKALLSTPPKPLPPDDYLNEFINNDEFKQFKVTVAGISHNNDDGSSRIKIAKSCEYGQKLLLVRDPENVHDSNAVKVTTESGLQLGFLDAVEAKSMQPTLKGSARASYDRAEAYFIESGTFLNEENKVMPYCKICIRKYHKNKSSED